MAALRWCKGCASIQRRQQQMNKGEGPKLPGMYVVLQRPEPEPTEPELESAPIQIRPADTVDARGVVIVG